MIGWVVKLQRSKSPVQNKSSPADLPVELRFPRGVFWLLISGWVCIQISEDILKPARKIDPPGP
ncbi:hypothetical protein Csa_001244 [Cucumis sativus]|uniref:Uncharacterized protein n=1 Tax=Cucumis sativus TaxID=3659 RepID=A0A0A0LCV8_CUCSA|nr:hypothetical protein Csa_001244 [Cucumis sativus]